MATEPREPRTVDADRAPAGRPPRAVKAEARNGRRRPAKPRGAENRSVRIRMYRTGLGDCFLVGLPRSSPREPPFWMLIDCGLIVGTSNAQGRIGEILDDVARTTGRAGARGGRIDLLVVTHEHWDHVSGFVDGAERFGRIEVGALWFAWTEDPEDRLAVRLRAERERKRNKLAALAAHLRSQGLAGAPFAAGLESLLQMFGADAVPSDPGSFGAAGKQGERTTAAALARARGLLRTGEPRYCRPSDQPATFDDVPGVRVFVLGPPPDEKALKRTDAKSEVYAVGDAVAAAAEQAFYAAGERAARSPADREEWDAFCPFDEQVGRPLRPFLDASSRRASDQPGASAADPLQILLDRHYLGPDVSSGSGRDQAWRRIDQDWLGAGAPFALSLDSATNNTSLVLAIELVGSRRVLLFAADAQVGNWLTWHDCSWTLGTEPDAERITGRDLLRRTVFYKVGHHGSHNATLEEKGLELMTSPELFAFIPVDQEVAEAKGWTRMPLPSLLDALTEQTRGRLLRADRPYGTAASSESPFKAEIEAFSRDLVETDLYFEVAVPV